MEGLQLSQDSNLHDESPNLEVLDKMILHHLNLLNLETKNMNEYIENILSSARKSCQCLGKEINVNEKKSSIECRRSEELCNSSSSQHAVKERTRKIRSNGRTRKNNRYQSNLCAVDSINEKSEDDKSDDNTQHVRCKKIAEFARKLKQR